MVIRHSNPFSFIIRSFFFFRFSLSLLFFCWCGINVRFPKFTPSIAQVRHAVITLSNYRYIYFFSFYFSNAFAPIETFIKKYFCFFNLPFNDKLPDPLYSRCLTDTFSWPFEYVLCYLGYATEKTMFIRRSLHTYVLSLYPIIHSN